MQISNAQIQKVLELHLHKVYAPQTKQRTSATSRADELVLSSGAQEIQKAQQAAENLPEIRMDLVRDFRQRIESGRYEIDSAAIAESMLG